jgi:hypothetical protein
MQRVPLVEDGPGLVTTESGTVHHVSPCNSSCMEDALQGHADVVERVSPSQSSRVTVSTQGHADLGSPVVRGSSRNSLRSSLTLL